MPSVRKVIARIKGGLGNQLFSYAAARRLALANDAELLIDDVSGFVRDSQYKRAFALQRFPIAGRMASPWERLEPFERLRRAAARWSSRRRPFEKRSYVEQLDLDFEPRLLALRVDGMVYLDGYWQSEDYFKDVESTIRLDVQPSAPLDQRNLDLGQKIRSGDSVALHVRWFDAPGQGKETHNAALEYYFKAIAYVEQRVANPKYFVFSDNPEAAFERLKLDGQQATLIGHNQGEVGAAADLWLMQQCRHFITANSTFSWWGAWLGESAGGIVLTPGMSLPAGSITAWNLPRQIPDRWVQL